jgi:hypothetical protein
MPNPPAARGARGGRPQRAARACRRAAAAAGLAWLAACSPALDWREVRVEGREAAVLLPCKPAAHARQVRLGDDSVTLTLQACQAAGMTWGVASADVADPTRVGAALQALREASVGNLGAPSAAALPLQVAGATPQDASGRAAYAGRRPDGQPVQAQVAVFSRGTVVYQATVLGERLSAEAADTFFGSLRLGG